MAQLILKRGLRANLPTKAPVGEPLYCIDSKELFIGDGEGIVPIGNTSVHRVSSSKSSDSGVILYNDVCKKTLMITDDGRLLFDGKEVVTK